MSCNLTKSFCHKQESEGDTKLLIISVTIDSGFALTLSSMPYVVVLQFSEATVWYTGKHKANVWDKRTPKCGSGFRINLEEAPFATNCKLGFTVPIHPVPTGIRQCHLIQGDQHDCDVRSCHHCQAGHTRSAVP